MTYIACHCQCSTAHRFFSWRKESCLSTPLRKMTIEVKEKNQHYFLNTIY